MMSFPTSCIASPLARFALSVIMSLVLLAHGGAQAHGGEDHDDGHDDHPAASQKAPNGEAPQRLPDGSLRIPQKAQQHMGLRTIQVDVQTVHRAIELQGRVLPDPNAGGRVQASQAGRIEAGPAGLPMPGQRVAKGQVLAYLRPVATSVERGNQLAAVAELQAQLAIAERRLARYAQLEGAIAQKDIDAARIEREALAQRLAALRGTIGAAQALTAPVNGVLSASHVAIGQVVDAREALFDLVDPARLMVEALLYDTALIDSLGDASASLPSGPLTLRLAGGGRQLREQALPVLFKVVPPRGQSAVPLAVGQSLAITVQTRQAGEGVALPRAALQRQANGEHMVWLQDAPEHFMRRAVSFTPLDAERVLVTRGLKAQERVVTDGAGLLAQIR